MKKAIMRLMAMLLTVVLVAGILPGQAFAAGLRLNHTEVYLAAGETFQMKNTKGGTTSWKSSKTSVATISKSGKVTAKKKGTTTITATCGGQKATAKITVKSSKKEAALATYKYYLSKDSFKWIYDEKLKAGDCDFTTLYVDDNSVPELLVKDSSDDHWYYYHEKLYTYKSGKLVDLNIDSFNGSYYYKKKGVFVASDRGTGQFDEYYSVISNGTAKPLVNNMFVCDNNDKKIYTYYDKNWKKISKSSYKSKLSAVVGSTQKTATPKLHKNTKKNRDKYLS